MLTELLNKAKGSAVVFWQNESGGEGKVEPRWDQLSKKETRLSKSLRGSKQLCVTETQGQAVAGARCWTNRQVQSHRDGSVLADFYDNPHCPKYQNCHQC